MHCYYNCVLDVLNFGEYTLSTDYPADFGMDGDIGTPAQVYYNDNGPWWNATLRQSFYIIDVHVVVSNISSLLWWLDPYQFSILLWIRVKSYQFRLKFFPVRCPHYVLIFIKRLNSWANNKNHLLTILERPFTKARRGTEINK